MNVGRCRSTYHLHEPCYVVRTYHNRIVMIVTKCGVIVVPGFKTPIACGPTMENDDMYGKGEDSVCSVVWR